MTNNQENKLAALHKLHPTYTEEELQEGYEQIMRFLDRGWNILLRLQKEGKLDEVYERHMKRQEKFDTHPVCVQLKLF